MKKIIISMFSFCFLALFSKAQDKFFTKTGKINFSATAPSSPENIEGVNNSVVCVMDTKTGNIQFSVLMKGFEFERALMQEHFNENYVESDKFPKTEFKGTVSNNSTVNYSKEGTYNVTVKGKLSMHGETKDVESAGKLIIKGGKINATAEFPALLSEYKITVPSLVEDKVAKKVKILVNCSLEPLK